MKRYAVHEIFKSIQGEGFNFGKEFVFVRFTGCNYSCIWCDQPTENNYEFTEEELIDKILEYGCKSVLFTGGEPTLQLKNSLIERLKGMNFFLAIETNGTNLIPEGIDYITVSPKMGKEFEIKVKEAQEVRVPAETEEIGNYLLFKGKIKALRYYLSPLYLEEKKTFDLQTLSIIYPVLKDEGFLISMQLHKIMEIL